MNKYYLLIVALFLGLGTKAQVTNPGFESGSLIPSGTNKHLLEGWEFVLNDQSPVAIPFLDTEIKHSGARSFRTVVTSQGNNTNPWNIRLDMTTDALHSFSKNDYVEFSFYARANLPGKNLSVKFRDANNNNWIQELKSLSRDFEKYSIGQIIAETRDDYKLSFFLAADTGTFWIDDVSVQVISNTVDQNPDIYHVSPDGDDANPGTAGAPFQTLEKASFVINGSDSLYLHEGTYRGDLLLDFKKGDAEHPIIIKAWPGDQVVIDGTLDITDGWVADTGGIYKRVMEQDIWGLYYKDSMMMAARWPDAGIYEHNFFNQKETYRDLSTQSSLGIVYDARPVNNELSEYYDLPTDGSYGYIRQGKNTQSLAASGVSHEGSVAILNIGSWMTWASEITKHEAGSNFFEYDTMFAAGGSTRSTALIWTRPRVDYLTPDEPFIVNELERWTAQNMCHYYLEGLSCLDAPGEWWYTPEDRMLYFIPPDDQDPNGKTIKVKVKDYSLQGKLAEHISIRDIDFYATAFYFESSRNISVENCNFLFPGHSQRVLGNNDRPAISMFNNKREEIVTAHRVVNCRFEYFDGDGFEFIGGSYNLAENVLLHDYNFSCIGSGMAVRTSDYDTSRQITFYRAGGSEGIAVSDGGVAEFIHMHHYGSLQHDGAGLQTFFKKAPVIYRYNWSHTTLKGGMRFDDGGGIPQPPSFSGQMSHNVSWTSRGFQIKGDSNLINNNLLFNTEDGLEVMVSEKMNGINTHTHTINNLADYIIDTGWKRNPAPGYLGSNVVAATDSIKRWLRDPDNLDFRPRFDDYVYEKGEEIYQCGEGSNAAGYCFSYDRPIPKLGKLPDMGPYETGTDNYWIPGFQYPHASTPIPVDKGTTKAEFTDLMWLKGYQSTSSDIYFGVSGTDIAFADKGSELYMGNQSNNIFYPGTLESGKTYYWRIDAVTGSGTVKGPVWSFIAGKDANPPAYIVEFKIYGDSAGIPVPLKDAGIRLGSRVTITDSEGTGNLKMVKPAVYKLELFRRGYHSKTFSLEILSDTTFVDTLESTRYGVAIQILDEDTGEPVPGCELDFSGEKLITDADGVVQLEEVEYAWYSLSASAPDYKPADFGAVEIYSDTSLSFRLVKDYLELPVKIVDLTSGDPVYRAQISYAGALSLTNSSGEARLEKILKGYLAFSISHNEYFTLSDSIMIAGDTSLVIHLTRTRARVQIEVQDWVGTVPNLIVKLNDYPVATDSRGVALFFNQPARRQYVYRIDKTGYRAVLDSFWLETDTLFTIVLEPALSVGMNEGNLTEIYPNPAGNEVYVDLPAESATLRLISMEGRLLMLRELTKGRFTLDVSAIPQGVYYLNIQSGDSSRFIKLVISR